MNIISAVDSGGFHPSLRQYADTSPGPKAEREKARFHFIFYLKLCPTSFWSLWRGVPLWVHTFPPMSVFPYELPPCITIIVEFFFFFSPSKSISSSCYISPEATIDPIRSNMNGFRWHLIIRLLDESGLKLPPSSAAKKTETCSRWSCPLEVSLFAVMEWLGFYSPDSVVGSVQAAAVNEPRRSLLCHAGISGSQYILLLVFLPAWNMREN